MVEHECKYNGEIGALQDEISTLKDAVSDVKVFMAEMKIDVKYIKGAADDLKICHNSLNACVGTIQLGIAGMPKADEIKKAIDKVNTHDTYFIIIGAVLLVTAALASGIMRDLVMFIITRL